MIESYFPYRLKSCKNIDKAGTEHICHGVYQNNGEEVLGFMGVKIVVHQTENYTDNQCGGNALIDVKKNTNQSGVEQSLQFVFPVYRPQEPEEEELLIKGIEQGIQDGKRT